MTKEEIRKFLDNTKVYVNGKSKEIQEKLFSFGYGWRNGKYTKEDFLDKPFLYIYEHGNINYGSNMLFFKEHSYKEITAEEILSLKITEPSYRPFNTKEECWQEMLKHEPTGWVKSIQGGVQRHICLLHTIEGIPTATFSDSVCVEREISSLFDKYRFADGTPFGVAED